MKPKPAPRSPPAAGIVAARMPGLPFGLSSGCTFEKCKVQTGDSGTVSLRVAGDVPPEKLKYEYQQSTTKDVDQKMWEHTNVETEGPTFTIDGLQPVATGGSLYVRVRWPTAAGGWSNWSQMASLRKWKGSASEDDAGDDVEDDAEPTRDAEPAPELTPPPEPGPTPVPDKVEHHNKLLAERKSAPAPQTKEKKVSLINDEEYTSQRAIDESLPTAGSERNTEPQTVQQQSLGSTSSSSASATANAVPQLTDEQKQAILDKVKAVKDDCRQAVKAGHQSDLTNAVDRDVGHDYTVSFKPKNEAAGQMRDSALSWKGHNHSGASEAELKRVLGLATESAGSKRKTEPQAVQQQCVTGIHLLVRCRYLRSRRPRRCHAGGLTGPAGVPVCIIANATAREKGQVLASRAKRAAPRRGILLHANPRFADARRSSAARGAPEAERADQA